MLNSEDKKQFQCTHMSVLQGGKLALDYALTGWGDWEAAKVLVADGAGLDLAYPVCTAHGGGGGVGGVIVLCVALM